MLSTFTEMPMPCGAEAWRSTTAPRLPHMLFHSNRKSSDREKRYLRRGAATRGAPRAKHVHGLGDRLNGCITRVRSSPGRSWRNARKPISPRRKVHGHLLTAFSTVVCAPRDPSLGSCMHGKPQVRCLERQFAQQGQSSGESARAHRSGHASTCDRNTMSSRPSAPASTVVYSIIRGSRCGAAPLDALDRLAEQVVRLITRKPLFISVAESIVISGHLQVG